MGGAPGYLICDFSMLPGNEHESWELGGVEFQEMTTAPLPPFSARNRRGKKRIDEDFPATARNGLLHVLVEAIERNYLRDWSTVIKELRRITRVAPEDYASYDRNSIQHIRKAQTDATNKLYELDWAQSYDFCERLYSHLTQDICREYNDGRFTTTKVEAQAFFAEEVRRVFDEEGLGYEFRDGFVQRRGNRHTITQTNKAEKALADQRLDAAEDIFRKHLLISMIVRKLTMRTR